MKYQSSHNTVNHHRGLRSALSFLMVPQMLFGVWDRLGGEFLCPSLRSVCARLLKAATTTSLCIPGGETCTLRSRFI